MRRSGVRIPLPPHLAWQNSLTDSPFTEFPSFMNTKTLSVTAAAISCVFLSLSSLAAQTPASSTSPGKQANRPIPFHGMVAAVDQKNKTFTISGKEATRVFKVTNKTGIMKGAAVGTMKDIADNEEVSGAYWKNPDGTLEAKFVKLGPTEKRAASPAPKASATPKS